MLFTTSWDDGYALDMRVAELLHRYGCKGTFYLCPQAKHSGALLTKEQIRELAKHHEIGAHTLTHPHLTAIPLLEAKKEIEESKNWVEQVTGRECRSFCYPYGDVNTDVRNLVVAAGYHFARTTEDLRCNGDDDFLMPVTLQVSPFPLRKTFNPTWKILDPLGPLRVRYMRLRRLHIPHTHLRSWAALARGLFQKALETKQPFFHLYGHSREIEKYGMWEELEEFLKEVSSCHNVQCVTNGE
jgi:peptidoglycan/xylan/chitin deacetylase (PgdA/CDA1 family)